MIRTKQQEKKFFKYLEARADYLLPLWNIEARLLVYVAVEDFLKTAPKSEAILARFFCSAWVGENRYDFDMMKAMQVLEKEDIETIAKYLRKPFFIH